MNNFINLYSQNAVTAVKSRNMSWEIGVTLAEEKQKNKNFGRETRKVKRTWPTK
jgi:hypothetical protein